ncbi:MAG: hypothetical protein IH595_07495 [Bacteroidales bacterium]|nr:hypothetical protein [Bacteroidales bacterium]
MKKFLWILMLGLVTTSFTPNQSPLTGHHKTSKYLADTISSLKHQGVVAHHPLIVIDGTIIGNKLNGPTMLPNKNDIGRITYFAKGSKEATTLYGEQGKNGVVLIYTKKGEAKLLTNLAPASAFGKTLYLVDHRPISYEQLKNINPKDIASISVLKSKGAVAMYTSGDYDGVVIITLKKPGLGN